MAMDWAKIAAAHLMADDDALAYLDRFGVDR
jgi:hypothetical protein